MPHAFRIAPIVGLLACLAAAPLLAQEAGRCEDPAATAAFQEGFALQKSGRSLAALAAFDRCLASEASCVPCNWESGWSLWTLGRFTDVVARWTTVATEDPGHADAKKWLPKARKEADWTTTRPATAPLGVEPLAGGRLKLSGPGVDGLPSCKADLAAVSEPPKLPTGSTLKHRSPKPDPAGMAEIRWTGSASGMPGGSPRSLPAQPLEGPPELLAHIGRIVKKGAIGRLRISTFGASHTSADHFTGRLRRVLQGRWGDGGHGFILPAALYKWYGGRDLTLCRTDGWLSDWSDNARGHDDTLLGFAGMSVSSSDARDFGWMETPTKGKVGGSVSHFDVYSLLQPGGGSVRVQVDGDARASIPTAGDKPRLQRTRIEVPEGPHRLRLAPKGDGEARLFGVSLERGSGVIVDAMGIRGQEARTWLKWEPTMAAQGWQSLDPDVVVLAYGTNEAADQRYTMKQYEADLTAVLSRLRAALPSEETACILAGPSDRAFALGEGRYAIWDRTAQVAEVQRTVGARFDCAFWDWQAATGGPGSMATWIHLDPPLAAKDGIHHTPAGYQFVADRFLAALDAL